MTTVRHARSDRAIGSAAGYDHDWQAGRDPAGISTQDPELAARFDPVTGGSRLANYLRTLTLETQTLARACGKSHVHNLEPEDLGADDRSGRDGASSARGNELDSGYDHRYMTYVIAEPCIDLQDLSCVEVCPVDCIHPTEDEGGFANVNQLFIDPEECIDCDACVEACPVDAIFAEDQLPDEWKNFTKIDADYYANASWIRG